MKKDELLMLVGLLLAVGGPFTGWLVSRTREARAGVAVRGGAPPEVLSGFMETALSWTAVGYIICVLGIVLAVTGLVMRSRAKRADAD